MSMNSETFRTYLFSYNHDGQSWVFQIEAESPEDARARVSRLAFATYDGELVAKVPVSLGLPARAFMAVRNSTHGLLRRLVGRPTKPV
jgi:hypothetical protein